MRVSIWGAAGTIGRNVVPALLGKDLGAPVEVQVVGRSEQKLRSALGALSRAAVVVADVATAEGARKAAQGVDAIVYSLGLPYTKRDFSTYPQLMRTAVAAAAEAGVRKFVLISNVYSYGVPTTTPVAETHPRNPSSVKGRYRKEQEDAALEANGRNGLRTTVLRLPDFYGPHAELSITAGIFKAALTGGTADLLGPTDRPHEFVFVPDAGRTIARILTSDRDLSGAFNLSGAGTITMRAFAEKVFESAGRPPALREVGPGMVKLLGLFWPLMRELSEMSYLLATPILLDGSKLDRALGTVERTSYAEGIQRTIKWMKATPA